MSERQDAIMICKIVMKRKFGVSIPTAIVEAAYDATTRFARDPGKRRLSPSKLIEEYAIKTKANLIVDTLKTKFNNIA